MNPKIILIGLALLVLFQSVFAANGITLTSPSQTFFLQNNTSLNAVYSISNQSNNRVCFDATAKSNPNDLEAMVASPYFCLNENEQTRITLSLIASSNTSSGSHVVDLNVSHDSNSENSSLSVKVGQNADIVLTANPESEYCSNESIAIPVSVKNNSSSPQSMELSSDSEGFLPSLSAYNLQLNAGESQTITIYPHANSSTSPGTYWYTITSRTNSQVSIQRFSFKLVSCEPEEPNPQPLFELETPSSCLNAIPGKKKYTSFSLSNNGNNPLTLWFSVSAPNPLDLDWEDNESPITLQADETQSISLSIDVPYGTEKGIYTVSVSASDLYQTKTGSICLLVGQPFEAELLPNYLVVQQGDSFGVGIRLKNNWNSSQSVSLSVSESDRNAPVSFSQTNVSVPKFGEKTVIATIRTNSTIPLGLHSIEFKASNSNATIKQKLFFTIVESIEPPIPPVPPTPPVEAVLKLITFPKFIDLNANETKELVFVVFNDSNETVSNIQVSLSGLPLDVSFVEPPQFSLPPNSSASVRGIIIAPESVGESQDYWVSIVAHNASFKNTKTMQLHLVGSTMEQKPQNILQALITGFMGLGGAFWLGLLILLVIVAAFLVFWSREHDTYRLHKEKWRQTTRRYS